jgi:hypothetical protein
MKMMMMILMCLWALRLFQSTATNSSVKITVVENDNSASNESQNQFNGSRIENNHVTEKNNQVPDELSSVKVNSLTK